jgi:adenylate cyclase
MEPQDVIALINECMERLGRVVEQTGGVVDKYVGDQVMALFGAPVALEDHALRAISAALRMNDELTDLNAKRRARAASRSCWFRAASTAASSSPATWAPRVG